MAIQSETTPSFWRCYWALPVEVRQKAQQAYKLWRANPSHPSLRFKRVKESQPIYSVRISRGYRALGLFKNGVITWFWIGTHDQYARLIGRATGKGYGPG